MAEPTLKERIAALEQRVKELEEGTTPERRVKDGRRTIGMFTDDKGMQEVFEEAQRLREQDRAHARRKPRKRA